jgi:hypothetical protein
MLRDPKLTPGGVEPGVTRKTIKTTICKRGYTSTVRHVIGTEREVIPRHGLPLADLSKVEIDHLISREIGCSKDTENLWLQYFEAAPGSVLTVAISGASCWAGNFGFMIKEHFCAGHAQPYSCDGAGYNQRDSGTRLFGRRSAQSVLLHKTRGDVRGGQHYNRHSPILVCGRRNVRIGKWIEWLILRRKLQSEYSRPVAAGCILHREV